MNKLRTFVVNQFKKHTGAKKAKVIEGLIYEQAEEHCRESETTTFRNHVYKQKASLILDYLVEDSQAKQLIKDGKLTEYDLVKLDKTSHTTEIDISQDDVCEGIFQCRKCGSKKTTYYSLQTRSADEPMTNFITCVACKNRWKM